MELRPTQDWIVMTFPTVPTRRGNIELPQSEIDRAQGRAIGVVLEVGPLASEFHEGQVLVFDGDRARTVAGLDRLIYRLCRAEDIIAVVESDEQVDPETERKIKEIGRRRREEVSGRDAAANLAIASGTPDGLRI